MNFLHLILFVFQLFPCISFYELGYNNLVLIEEGKSVEVKCLPSKEIPENIIKTEWYNITLESIDPNNGKNQVLLKNFNPSLVIDREGSMIIEKARPEISGYYSCELHFFQTSSDSSDPVKDTKFRLHLIEVTKQPSLSALKTTLLIRLYAKSKTLLKEQIYILIENLVSKRKHEFESHVEFHEQNVLCEFDSYFKLTKCKIRIKFKSRNKCLKTNCKKVLEHSLKKDLKEMKNLLKVSEIELQKVSNELVEIDIRNMRIKTKPFNDCSEGHYFEENRCRPCHSGHYKPIESDKCITCPTNTYNPFFGQSSCFECPPDTKTIYDFEGATLEKECRHQGFSGFLKDNIVDFFS